MTFDRESRSAKSSELAAAVGRVAMRTADLEDELRFNLEDLIIDDDFIYITIGQDLSWLINYLRIIIGEHKSSGYRWHDSIYEERLAEILDRVSQIRDRRNSVIHGTWRDRCFADDCSKECRPRPYGDRDEDGVFHVSRHRRQSRGFVDQKWTISDVERLAEDATVAVEDLQNNRWARRSRLRNLVEEDLQDDG